MGDVYICRSSSVPKAQLSADYLRRNGSCPLTPEEVGLLLAGLGFKNTTPIYVAGKVSFSLADCFNCEYRSVPTM